MMQMDKLISLWEEAMPAQGSQGRWSLLYMDRAFAPAEGLVR